ncbi:DUF2971 domain-containing protein [Ralstonia wenshanensis]|uniref:DUF2971 domain-containing protein n=1 Tax=Ralstonia wenshanensis TaxID=2842456 RepID=UPI001E4575E8|nr:DUF2971 domain-containing protein [Ralstonia wenshanensis]UGS92136.1 DUF2971 domain-containing protein [Ralstonia wenshanensis]
MNRTEYDLDRALHIFHPIGQPKIIDAQQAGKEFAYYTTADVAVSILRNKTVWMRNAATMNDYMEIEYGVNFLLEILGGEEGQQLESALDGYFPKLWSNVFSNFKSLIPGIRRDTFITCLSEHLPQERELGRLSMWRAYGGKDGVALIIDATAIVSGRDDGVGAYSSPVEYMDEQNFKNSVLLVAERIRQDQNFISSIPGPYLERHLKTMLLLAILCVKHPGFKEEREWRVFITKFLSVSDRLKTDIEIVRGTPQHVVKIPIGKEVDGKSNRKFSEIVKGVIIGPCAFPEIAARAFRELMEQAGFSASEARQRVTISGIPLRHL